MPQDRLTVLARRQPWLSLFLKFIDKLRIDSKEMRAEDERGSRLILWQSQRMALEQIAEGIAQNQRMVYILKGRQQGLCYDPSMRVLTADLRWVPISDIQVGDEVVACDEYPDGRKSRYMRTAKVEAVREVQEWAFELGMDDGAKLIATGAHRHLCRVRGAVHTEWRRVSKTKVGDHIRRLTSVWDDIRDYEDGWIGGMADGEGSLGGVNRKGRTDLAIHQVAGSVLERMRSYFLDRGYNFREEIDRRNVGDSSKLGNKPVHKLRIGRTAELFRLMGVTRPTRFVGWRWWEGKNLPGKKIGDVYGEVVSIKSLGERRMIDLQTSTKTFICEGYVSHNSTITLALLLFWVAVHPRTIAALVCNLDEVRDAFRDNLDRYMRSFPPDFFGASFGKARHNERHFLFTNGSRIDYLVAGKRKTSWGESRGYSACLCTEVADYGTDAGLKSFMEALAQENDERLFMFESTAKGPNHWQEMWYAAEEELSIARIFLGWWSKEGNAISKHHPNYRKFGIHPPNGEEHRLCTDVMERFGHVVTMEQLAWYRWRLSLSDRQTAEQNQPWLPEEAFVMSGYSFFQMRKLQDYYDLLLPPNPPAQYKAYRVEMGNSFWAMKLEQIMDPARADEVELKVWEDPIKEAQYVIGCDPAFGHSEDSDNHCLDTDTEILTIDGWKRHDQINVGDQAVCFDPDTGEYSYGSILRKIIKDVDEDLYHFEGRGADILATADHRMVYRYRHGANENPQLTDWDVCTASELADLDRIFIHCPAGRAPCGEGIEGLSLEMCRLIGWTATDGHIRKHEYAGIGAREGQKSINRFVYLVQSVDTIKAGISIADEMERVVVDMFPDTYHRRRAMPDGRPDALIMRIGVKTGVSRLVKWFDDAGRLDRRLITEASSAQLAAIFQGMLEGDGNWNGFHDRWAKLCPGYDQNLADDMQEIAMRLGYSATINQRNGRSQQGHDQYLVHLSSVEHRRIKFQGTVPYQGKVWCVTVPTGAFVARRNGNVFVTGNCISVWRCYADKLVQVAEYADNRFETSHCAWILAGLAGAYHNCMVNLELYGPGRVVMNEFDNIRSQLRQEMFNPMNRENRWDDEFMAGARWFMYRRVDNPGPGFVYNFETNQKRKFELFNMFRDKLTSDMLVIKSMRMLEEMAKMVQEKSDIAPQSPGRQHDDRPFAAALAVYAWDAPWGLRAPLIAAGATYERVTAEAAGRNTAAERMMDRLVYNYLQRRASADEEDADEPEPWANESWYEQRGLM